MNAVSYSLYGTGEVYLRGLMENLRRLPVIYPGWQALVFTDGAAGGPYLERCEELGACVLLRPPRDDSGGMFWRFEAAGDPRWDAVIVRDADSVVGSREQVAVSAWLARPEGIHMMTDSEHHLGRPVLGGMWGVKRGAWKMDFPHLVRWWLRNKGPFGYDDDQWFLNRFVWPYAMRDGLRHAWNVRTRLGGELFPCHAPEERHVGQRWTAGELPEWTDEVRKGGWPAEKVAAQKEG